MTDVTGVNQGYIVPLNYKPIQAPYMVKCTSGHLGIHRKALDKAGCMCAL